MVKNICTLLLAALCAGILLTAVPHAHAEFREEGTALIERKGPNALMFEAHGFKHFVDRYMLVTALTRFYDENGEQISLEALKFPCQARILYRQKKSQEIAEVLSVHVEHYRDDRPIGTQFNLPAVKPDRPR